MSNDITWDPRWTAAKGYGASRGLTTYDAVRQSHAKRNGLASVRSIWFRPRGSVFCGLALPTSGNHGQFCRAPKTVRS